MGSMRFISSRRKQNWEDAAVYLSGFLFVKSTRSIVKFHIDYYQPLYLDEEFTVKASYLWSEGAKLHIEYAIIKMMAVSRQGAIPCKCLLMHPTSILNKDERLTTRITTLHCLSEILEKLRKDWKKGKFKCLK